MNFELLKKALDNIVAEGKAPGVDCIIYKNHEQVFRYFTGLKDIENGKKIDGNELYLIYSMTKMLTCVSALQLFEKGKFKMEDCLSDYIPEFGTMKLSENSLSAEDAAKITTGSSMGAKTETKAIGYAKNPIRIIDLFTMSAGLDYNLQADGIKKAVAEGRTSTKEIVKALSETVLGFEPGTDFNYSLCHDVLGVLVEIWSGLSLGEYMQKNIFEPIGMKDTFFDVPKDADRLSRMAVRYTIEDGKYKALPLKCLYNVSPEYESGGAGLCSSPLDYALFLDAMANGGVAKSGNRILNADTIDLMRKNRLQGKGFDSFQLLRPGYGYGLGVRTHLDPEVSGSLTPVGEFGWDGAAGAFAMVVPESGMSLTYFQHCHAWVPETHIKMRNALYGCFDEKKIDV